MINLKNTSLALLLAAALFASVLASGASAQHGTSPGSGESIYVNPSTGHASPAPTVRPSVSQSAVDEPAEPTSSGGFDWPSAGIGAAAGAALLLALMAAAGLRRTRVATRG
jgi:hypothetical protein